ncbi:unnamed protein product [Paramecium sonneborni]|uniref:Uncharacterized protein n=1 Tax=Paramecium sonneborni TaxID=65129 RepID=A0A8S1LR44_9CILI|nr:unnamed protein product [Paramecium sonneborni]
MAFQVDSVLLSITLINYMQQGILKKIGVGLTLFEFLEITYKT